MGKEVFILDPRDNVATLISENGKKGTSFQAVVGTEVVSITLGEDIPFGYKFATRSIPKGSPVLKYGYKIGTATTHIKPGELVHVHNIESNRGRGDLAGRTGKLQVES